jgi:hypothetical protein
MLPRSISRLSVTGLRLRLALAAIAAFASAGCGDEIGDSCTLSSECASDGTRTCIAESDGNWPGGYCSILGCGTDTCPDEAVCVRFYTSVFANRACDPATEDISTDVCGLDEACSFEGRCALRSAENRFCMKGCSDDGDCRDGYECRNADLMRCHGGEPVLPPDQRIGDDPPRFCALKGDPNVCPGA